MGLPTALLLAKQKYTVYGYDIDPKQINLLKKNILPFEEKGLKELYRQSKKHFHPISELKESDVFIIAVPTPITNKKTCDLSYVVSATKSVSSVLQKHNLVILESTVPPGTTIKIVKPILDVKKIPYYLSYVSEKAMPGNTLFEMQNNHRIIGGINKVSTEKTRKIYKSFVKSDIHLTDPTTAETVKLMENSFRDVNIALANELAKSLEFLKVNIWEAIELANHHPRVNFHKPGPGVGGHCISVDPWFLVSEKTPLIQQARKINDSMPLYIFSKVKELVNDKPKPVISIFGVAYKGNVDDTRETPALPLIEYAKKEGYLIRIYDPYVKNFHYPLSNINDVTTGSDCIIVLTDHLSFKQLNPKSISKNMRTQQVLDTRNILNKRLWTQAGFKYYLAFNFA